MKFMILIVVSFLLISIQATVLSRMSILEIKPDLILIGIYSLSIYNRMITLFAVNSRRLVNFNDIQTSGMVIGAIMGFLLDIVSGVIVGPNLVSKSCVGFLAGKFSQNIFKMDTRINVIFLFILSIVDGIIVYLSLIIFWHYYPFVDSFIRIIFIQSAYNCIGGAVILTLLRYLYLSSRLRGKVPI